MSKYEERSARESVGGSFMLYGGKKSAIQSEEAVREETVIQGVSFWATEQALARDEP